MTTYRYSFALEVGTYTPQTPKTIDAETIEKAAEIAKSLYEANPFSVMGGPPLRGEKILLTFNEGNSFHGATFDYDTLKRQQ